MVSKFRQVVFVAQEFAEGEVFRAGQVRFSLNLGKTSCLLTGITAPRASTSPMATTKGSPSL